MAARRCSFSHVTSSFLRSFLYDSSFRKPEMSPDEVGPKPRGSFFGIQELRSSFNLLIYWEAIERHVFGSIALAISIHERRPLVVWIQRHNLLTNNLQKQHLKMIKFALRNSQKSAAVKMWIRTVERHSNSECHCQMFHSPMINHLSRSDFRYDAVLLCSVWWKPSFHHGTNNYSNQMTAATKLQTTYWTTIVRDIATPAPRSRSRTQRELLPFTQNQRVQLYFFESQLACTLCSVTNCCVCTTSQSVIECYEGLSANVKRHLRRELRAVYRHVIRDNVEFEPEEELWCDAFEVVFDSKCTVYAGLLESNSKQHCWWI